MGNRVWNGKANENFKMSNGATDVFISVLILAGSDLAETTWEKELVAWLADHDILGCSDFDVDEIAWDRAHFEKQKAFLLAMIDAALRRHRWEALDYDPPYVHINLAQFRVLVDKYTLDMIESAKPWKWIFGDPRPLARCSKHDVYLYAAGCFICNNASVEI